MLLPKTLRPTAVALAAGLTLAALAPAAGAQPATPENQRILTPSVSESAPAFGGKAVLSSTPGVAGSTSSGMTPPSNLPTDPGAGTAAPGGASAVEVMPPGAVAMPAAGRAGAVVVPEDGAAYAAPVVPPVPPPGALPVPAYGPGNQPYTREVVTGGDVVVLPDGNGTVTTVDTVRLPANVPRKGSTMADVRARYGEPASVYKTGGGSRAQPPITRWTYPGFNVVFEYTHVVDVVVPGAPPPLVRTGGLSRVPVNPANPKYKGTPGRALRLRGR